MELKGDNQEIFELAHRLSGNDKLEQTLADKEKELAERDDKIYSLNKLVEQLMETNTKQQAIINQQNEMLITKDEVIRQLIENHPGEIAAEVAARTSAKLIMALMEKMGMYPLMFDLTKKFTETMDNDNLAMIGYFVQETLSPDAPQQMRQKTLQLTAPKKALPEVVMNGGQTIKIS